MLVMDLKCIGNRFYELRTKKLISRADVAEKAGLSDRTYADIERGSVNMRIETFLRLCQALNITPNDVLVQEDNMQISDTQLVEKLENCTEIERKTACELVAIYLNSLGK